MQLKIRGDMIVIKKIFARVAKAKAFLAFLVTSGYIIYFVLKYYTESQLLFEKNFFIYFLIFAWLVIWGFCYLIYENIQNKRKTKKLQENDEVMKEMLQIIINNQYLTNDNIEKMNRNTRRYIVDALSMREESIG